MICWWTHGLLPKFSYYILYWGHPLWWCWYFFDVQQLMKLDALIFSVYIFTVVVSSCWIVLLTNMKWSSLCLLISFSLKFTLGIKLLLLVAFGVLIHGILFSILWFLVHEFHFGIDEFLECKRLLSFGFWFGLPIPVF